MNLPAHQPAAWEPEAEESTASGWFPGPLVRKLLLVALAAIALSGSLAAWWVSHAMGQEAMVMDAIKLGALDFIVKPFKADRIVQTVNKILPL